jgi:inner centromere protein
MTPDKVFQPSTENDYNVNDLSSGDETDNEDNPRKKVPRWAEKSTLRTHVQNLFRHVSKNAVNDYFGLLKAPKIATLFANNDKNYDSMMHNETTAWDSP